MASEHSHKMTSWVTVVLIIVAATVLGFAFVAQSVPLAVIGAVIGVAGLISGVAFGLMDDAH